jgi:hypothetical protein
MGRQPEKQARAEAILGELAELSLMVARELATRLRESEDVEETVALAGAFQKVTRVVRLTLALDAKLERDAARDAAAEAQAAEKAQARAASAARYEALTEAARQPADPIETRKTRVRGLVNRLLWTESEGDQEDYEVLVEDLDARLDEAALSPDFETLPVETLTRRVIADMDLTGRFALSLGEPEPAPRREPQPANTG